MPMTRCSDEYEARVRIRLPMRNAGHPSVVSFEHRSNEWRNIHPRYVDGDRVTIPGEFSAPEARMDDEPRYIVGEGGQLVHSASPVQPGSIALVLESPHHHEYDSKLRALRPLNNASSERLLMRGLPHLLGQIEALSGIALAGRQIVLVNSIQYQCSLHHFMRSNVRKLQRCVRDAVWTAMFDAGGAEDLLARLKCIDPAFVVLAPTRLVGKILVNRFGQAPRPWPWALTSGHPTSWRPPRTYPKPVSLAPDDKLIVMPNNKREFTPSRWIQSGSKPYRCPLVTILDDSQ